MSHQFCVCAFCFLRPSCRRSNTRRWPNVGLLLASRLRRESTLAQCWVTVSCLTPRWMWASITDGGPTLTQLLFKASCGYYSQHEVGLLTTVEWILASTGDDGPTFTRHWVGVSLHCLTRNPANTSRWTSAGLMLGQHRRRWTRMDWTSIRSTCRVCWECWQATFHITGCEDIKTVAQLIEPKDDVVTVE